MTDLPNNACGKNICREHARNVTILAAGGGSFDLSAFGHLTGNERDYGGALRWNMPF